MFNNPLSQIDKELGLIRAMAQDLDIRAMHGDFIPTTPEGRKEYREFIGEIPKVKKFDWENSPLEELVNMIGGLK